MLSYLNGRAKRWEQHIASEKSQQAVPIQQKPNSFLQTGNRKNAFKILTSRAKAAKIAETDFVGVVSFLLEYAKIAVKLRRKFFSQLTEGKYQKLAVMFLRVQHYTPFFDNLREYQLNIAMSLKSLTFHHGYDSPFNLPKIVV